MNSTGSNNREKEIFAQALALMEHPNIARVFDGGATDTGRPYFVLELVRGLRLTEFCDQHQLPTVERRKLFIQVCHAIQHAHQKAIIHRDIKPSNILVSLPDDVPVPKVIDFGIAKAVGERRRQAVPSPLMSSDPVPGDGHVFRVKVEMDVGRKNPAPLPDCSGAAQQIDGAVLG